MRVGTEVAPPAAARRRGVWVLALAASLILLVVALQGLAGFYVNFLWFKAAHVGVVWRAIVATKLGLAGVFVAVAMALVWASLWLADKIAERTLFLPGESELVRRYHAMVLPHAFVLRTAVALLVALALGSGTTGQWQHWLLFEHAVPFDLKDPQFHRDVSFYVFRLPFLSFLVDWLLITLVVTLVVSAVAHFLAGTIRVQGPSHLEPRAVAHLSLLLGLLALVRAWGYYYVDRYALELSHDGVVAGMSYTDQAVRLPAITLLAVVSLIAFVMLVFNVYQRTVVLPAVALGLWLLVALTIGLIYPAVEEAVTVAPAQSRLEAPAIADNMAMTRLAMGIGADKVSVSSFPASEDLTSEVLAHYRQTLADAPLWDTSRTGSTFAALQDTHAYYDLGGLSLNRYRVNGQLDPVVVAVRRIDYASLASQSWVNVHLEYTHGYGAVIAAANSATPAGTPQFLLKGVPPLSSPGAPRISESGSRIFFQPGGERFVVVDTKQSDVDYEPNGVSDGFDYAGGEGVPIGGWVERLAFAVKLRDLDLLTSDLITSSSKIVYLTGVRSRVEKALPFLKIDTNPYPVVAGGRTYWLLDAYAATSYFPDAEQADTSALPAGSGLAGSYDYVRDAVQVVVDAGSGQMGFYVLDPSDPLMRSYEATYPRLFKPLSALAKLAGGQLIDHLRYPQDLLAVQASMYGVYHAANASQLYLGDRAWAPPKAPNGSAGSSYRPQYELLQWQPDSQPTFTLVEPLVPLSGTNAAGSDDLSAVLEASSSPGAFGQLHLLEVGPRSPVRGPAYAAGLAERALVTSLPHLRPRGSAIELGTVQVMPVADSLIYVCPVYVTPGSRSNAYPLSAGVVVVYGDRAVYGASVAQAMAEIVGGTGRPRAGTTPAGAPQVSRAVASDLAAAARDYRLAERALGRRDLASYQRYTQLEAQAVQAAQAALGLQAGPRRSGASSARTTTSSVVPGLNRARPSPVRA